MKITFEQLLSFRPCDNYKDREYVLSLTGGREEIEVVDVPSLPIPEQDKVWLLLKVLGIFDGAEKKQRLFACDCAERALLREREAGREPDPRSWNAVSVAREYAMGRASKEELKSAKTAASASYASASYASAAYDAAYADAAAAAAYAAYAAYADAADAAYAYAAAYAAAAAAAERKWQVKKLLEYIGV